VSPNLDAAARALGQSAFATLRTVHVPLLRPAIGAAALMVFVDSMKELPATLLLRPFNFETLATHVYSNVALERFDDAGLAALVIIAVGLLPVLLLHATMSHGRAGGAMREE
jgi:iron(III) transport system permease protein